tara:strand:+ start:223 stop:480 length:258 start_codon:yes stop_codon:yes gene_type:complete
MKNQKEDYYRVVASTPSRTSYPVYRFYNEPEDWSCNGTVNISCKDGKVDVTIFEKDSINIHRLEVYSDGPVGARLTEQLDHPERP